MRNVWYGKLFHLSLDLYDIEATIVLSNIEQVSIEFQNSICQNGWAITVSIQPVWIFRPNIGQFQNVCNEKLFCMLLDLFDIKPKIVYNSIEKVSSEFEHSISQNEWAITVFIHPVWILRQILANSEMAVMKNYFACCWIFLIWKHRLFIIVLRRCPVSLSTLSAKTSVQ